RPGELTIDEVGLSKVDRHEVSHCVISSFLNLRSNPPALLIEGYAEANAGIDPVALAVRAWESRKRGAHVLSLRELTSTEWYGRHQWSVYVQGSVLVNYILKTFGAERFIELYATGQPGSFALDCKRILGVSLDELDAAYWADIDATVRGLGSIERWRLGRLRLDAGIDRAAWRAFLDEYFVAARRLQAPYDQFRAVAERTYVSKPAVGKESSNRMRYELARSGPFRSLRHVNEHQEVAYLANPRHSIDAYRDRKGGPWTVRGRNGLTPTQDYDRVLSSIRDEDPLSWSAGLIGIADEISRRADPADIVVADFSRIIDKGRRIVRVRFEDKSKPPERWNPWTEWTLELAADGFFIPMSSKHVETHGCVSRGTYEYKDRDGIPILTRCLWSGESSPGIHNENKFVVLETRFGAVAETEFDPDRFLDGPRIDQEASAPGGQDASTTNPRLYPLPIVAGVLALAVGLALRFTPRKVVATQTKRSTTENTETDRRT
ncbi:MAG: hypothetical protein ACYCUI_16445, partial [Vulcanimicrobiaceae bacterium]